MISTGFVPSQADIRCSLMVCKLRQVVCAEQLNTSTALPGSPCALGDGAVTHLSCSSQLLLILCLVALCMTAQLLEAYSAGEAPKCLPTLPLLLVHGEEGLQSLLQLLQQPTRR